ncbi:MAG: phosphatidylserine decarboxylase family protein [Ignavibacteriaceae bacterium]|jgi:phosphatidylserine decarboxylase|nr:phosphatidylserine decarboxylase family protein [Ignavibacteriaceae bacterium]
MFTKYGYTTIGVVAMIAFILISISFITQSNPLKIILILIAAVILLLTLNFFRDPERKAPSKDGIIVTPADGKVIVIKQNISNSFVGENCNQISIFMSPLNVHVNRIPISGKVKHLKYYEGKFIAAFEDKASENNERMETGIVSNGDKILFTQIAGFLARRIVNDLTIGEDVTIGERFGMIKFGSRVDIFVSGKWKPVVQLNDDVHAGETILFELKD